MPQTLLIPIFFATPCRRPLIFQIMNSVRSKSLSLKYLGCKDRGIKKFEYVAKNQVPLLNISAHFYLIASKTAKEGKDKIYKKLHHSSNNDSVVRSGVRSLSFFFFPFFCPFFPFFLFLLSFPFFPLSLSTA